MRSYSSWIKAAVALLSVVATVAFVKMAYACTSPPPTPPPPPQITHLEGPIFSVRITGYSSFGAEQGQTCGCGLAVGVNVTVTGVRLVLSGTDTPVPGFGTFNANSRTTNALQTSATPPAGTQWSGFSAQIVNPGVQPDEPTDLLFTVQSEAGIAQVAKILKTNLIGTGEVDPTGSEFIHHFATASTQVLTAPILAEASPVQSGFYECKVQGKPSKASANEDTLLLLVNQSTTDPLCATVVLMDGKQKVVACGGVPLSPGDLDEINLCRVPTSPGLVLPPAGVVEVVTTVIDATQGCPPDPTKLTPDSFAGGVYGWIKDVVYRGRKSILADPFTAPTLLGIGKTELRLAPPEVSDPTIVFNKCWELTTPPNLLPSFVYAEDTLDSTVVSGKK